MKHYSITGSYSVGKSSLLEEVRKERKDALYTPDLARDYLNRNNLKSDNMTLKQKQDMQMWVAATYIGSMMQAERSEKTHIMDGSIIEVFAYSDEILPPSQIAAIGKFINKHRENILALVLLPTLPLEKDGLRHTSEEFRITIHQRIMDIIHAFKIEYQFILGNTVRERAEEVQNHIEYPNKSVY